MKTVLYFRLLWRLSSRATNGIYQYARKAGWHVQIVECGRNTPSLRQAVEGARADGCIVDGLFLNRIGWSADVFAGLPTVFIDARRTYMKRPYSGVENDAAECAKLAMEELLTLGYEHYAYADFMEATDWSEMRCRVFEKRVAAAGKKGHVFHIGAAGAERKDAFYNCLGPWIASLPRPCGIFAANDRVAEMVLTACRLEKIAVPESIAIIGVDDDETICENAVPTLSSVRPDFEGCGYKAAELLDKLMKRPNRRPEIVRYGCQKTVRRNSTRLFKRRDAAVRNAVEWVRLNACRGISPADVIAQIGGSRRSAEMRFRAFSGRSIGEEITAVRLERAKALLAKPLVPVNAIYAECGYSDPTSLRKAFRKAFGRSPREWRIAQTSS